MTKKHFIALIMIGLSFFMFSCGFFDPTPEKYISGIELEPGIFPEEDIQFDQNSVLFRRSMATKYGISALLGSDDKINVLANRYLEMLNINGLMIAEVENIDNGLIIKGQSKDYKYSIKIIDVDEYETEDKYVKREYETITIISINNSIVKQLDGLWFACGVEDNLLLMDNGIMADGIAYEFKDGYVTGYALGMIMFEDVAVEWVDDKTIAFDISGDGNKITTTVADAHMPWDGIDETIVFTELSGDTVYMKTTHEDMMFRVSRAQSIISSFQ